MFQRNAWASIMGLCLCSFALCTPQASAQDNKVLKQYYGNGVHAFYSGNFAEAYDLLTKPIDAKIQDPRPYYFRGFALMELGRPEQAVKDFKDGAALELKDTTGRFPVNFALERCQGRARLALESARAEVQLADYKRRVRDDLEIYGGGSQRQYPTLEPERQDQELGLENLDTSGSQLEIEDENLLETDDGTEGRVGGNTDEFDNDDPNTEDVDPFTNTNKPADDDNLFDNDAADDEKPSDIDAADDDDNLFGNDAADDEKPADDDGNLFDNDAADNDAADDEKPAEDDAADTFDDIADNDKPADDDAAAESEDPFKEETAEETAEANPFKDANLDDDDDAAADDNADDDAAPAEKDKADDADAPAEDNSDDDIFDF